MLSQSKEGTVIKPLCELELKVCIHIIDYHIFVLFIKLPEKK